jgi:hypothetical protein
MARKRKDQKVADPKVSAKPGSERSHNLNAVVYTCLSEFDAILHTTQGLERQMQ